MECDIASTLLQRRGCICPSVFRYRRQFLLRNVKVDAAAIQADQKLREYQDPGFVQIFEAGEMDDHLRIEFCLIALATFPQRSVYQQIIRCDRCAR